MNLIEIVFSPTGGTQRVVNILAQNMSQDVIRVDLSDPNMDFGTCNISQDDFALIALPSYGGRAPEVALDRLRMIGGNGAKASLVCVYGNRDFEDTLVEMADMAAECGFEVTSAITAVAEHSIFPQFATRRPDAADAELLARFAKQLADADRGPKIPGNRPYKTYKGVPLTPKTNGNCTNCGACAHTCPVQAIDPETSKADADVCISCMRCLRTCPRDGRQLNSVLTSAAALKLKSVCADRKNPRLYL